MLEMRYDCEFVMRVLRGFFSQGSRLAQCREAGYDVHYLTKCH